MFRSLLWAFGLAAFGGMLGYLIGIGLAAILGYASGGMFIAAEALHMMGYVNASKAVNAEAANTFYQSQTIPYATTVAGAGIASIVGYFKGKKEDVEESH